MDVRAVVEQLRFTALEIHPVQLPFRAGRHQQAAIAGAQERPDVLRIRVEELFDLALRPLPVDLAVRRRTGVHDPVAVDPDREHFGFLGGEEFGN